LLRRIYTGAHSGSNPNRLQTSDEPFCINDMKSDKMSQTTLSFVAVSNIEKNFMRTGAERRREKKHFSTNEVLKERNKKNFFII